MRWGKLDRGTYEKLSCCTALPALAGVSLLLCRAGSSTRQHLRGRSGKGRIDLEAREDRTFLHPQENLREIGEMHRPQVSDFGRRGVLLGSRGDLLGEVVRRDLSGDIEARMLASTAANIAQGFIWDAHLVLELEERPSVRLQSL